MNVDSVLADFFFLQRLRESRTEILQKSWRNGALHADKKLTSQLIGVFDAFSCWLFHNVFARVLLTQVFESSFVLGDA